MPDVSGRSPAGLQASFVAAAPVLFLAALLAHPQIPGRLPNAEVIGAAVAADPTRWALAHLAVGVASGLLAVAFLIVHGQLRAVGEGRWSGPGLGLVVIASAAYAILPGMEFAPFAAVEAGADPAAAQRAIGAWFMPVLLGSSVVFALGVAGFVVDITRAGLPTPGLAVVVAAALVVMAGSRVVPFAAVQLYVQGGAGLVVFWPLAHAIRATRGVPGGRPEVPRGSRPLTPTRGGHP